MEVKLTPKDAVSIAIDYQQKYKVPGFISENVQHSVKYYENFHRVEGPAWLVISQMENNRFEGDDHFSIIISDVKKVVEYIIDFSGFSHSPHKIDNDNFTEEELSELLEEDD
ncbi:hypothetical protein GKZ89_16490 [Bacillus mangrovi]|uniref:Uncharacterized protein n=1 Tax=Metabacillus mangrovi TaxID=1491830 RepID=A0A7X2V6E4_9BACI|nr:hypothetical protein [Metabacillus mangrovi]MTH55003.1 hypothetical protein [Metabacillus mangrovi]